MPSVLAMHSNSASKSRPKKPNKRTVNLLQQNIAQSHRLQTNFNQYNQSYINNNNNHNNTPPNTNGYYNRYYTNNNIMNHRKKKQDNDNNNNNNSTPPNQCYLKRNMDNNNNNNNEYSSKLTQDPNFLSFRSPFYETLSRHCVMPICQKQLINFQFNLPKHYVEQIKECYKQKTKNKKEEEEEEEEEECTKMTEERVLHIRLFDLTETKHVDWSRQLFVLKINEKSVTIPDLIKDKDKKKKLGQKAKGFQFVQPLDISKYADERMDFEIACYKEIFHGAASIEIVNVLSVEQIGERVIERSELAMRLQQIEDNHFKSPIIYGISSILPPNECAVCGKQESSTIQLSRCSRCKSTWYCSTKCQQENWDRHLLGCRPFEELSQLRLIMTDPRYSKKNEDIICDEIKVSIRDPLSLCKIKTPIRGIKCYHPQCLDLNTYLSYSHSTKHWQCPICMQPLLYKELCVDKNMAKIIKELDDDIDCVRLNPDDYSYKVVTLKEIQENDNKTLSGTKKRKRKSISPTHKKKKKKRRKICSNGNLNGKYTTKTVSKLQSEIIVID